MALVEKVKKVKKNREKREKKRKYKADKTEKINERRLCVLLNAREQKPWLMSARVTGSHVTKLRKAEVMIAKGANNILTQHTTI
jgi:hypothetical protein